MKKILTVLAVLSIFTFVPQTQAGVNESKSYKLSVTVPESIHQKQDNPQALLSSSSTTNAFSQGFQLVEAVRNNQKIVLITYVVE